MSQRNRAPSSSFDYDPAGADEPDLHKATGKHEFLCHALEHDAWPCTSSLVFVPYSNNPLKKRHAGVGDGGIVLVRNAAVIAEHLAFFGLDESEQAVDR